MQDWVSAQPVNTLRPKFVQMIPNLIRSAQNQTIRQEAQTLQVEPWSREAFSLLDPNHFRVHGLLCLLRRRHATVKQTTPIVGIALLLFDLREDRFQSHQISVLTQPAQVGGLSNRFSVISSRACREELLHLFFPAGQVQVLPAG